VRPPHWWLPDAARQVWRGETQVRWSPQLCAYESEVLRRLMAARHARVVSDVAQVGEVYELPGQ
jgi:hypothetical protein